MSLCDDMVREKVGSNMSPPHPSIREVPAGPFPTIANRTERLKEACKKSFLFYFPLGGEAFGGLFHQDRSLHG
jgi:hypothetical protein